MQERKLLWVLDSLLIMKSKTGKWALQECLTCMADRKFLQQKLTLLECLEKNYCFFAKPKFETFRQ
jgi:hypothetical protein